MFFTTVFNTAGRTRAALLLRLFRQHDEGDAPISGVQSASRLANDPTVHQDLRNLYWAYAAAAAPNIGNNALTQVISLAARNKFKERLDHIYNTPTDELREIVMETGGKTSQGRGWDSLIVSYINESLGYAPKSNYLPNAIADASLVSILVTNFTLGVLALTPAGLLTL